MKKTLFSRRFRKFWWSAKAVLLSRRFPPPIAADVYRMARTEPDARKSEDLCRLAVSIDPDAHPVDRRIVANWGPKFFKRRRLARWIRNNRRKLRPKSPDEMGVQFNSVPIFMYWAQGFDSAPRIVQICKDQLIKSHGVQVVLLDSGNWKTYASLPEEIEEKLQDQKALFSDLLRLSLINNHGGIWVDATCFVTENLLDNALINSDADFFAFSSPAGKALISNWLLAGKRGNFITGTMLNALIAYWLKFDKPLYYHLFHGIFEVMYFTDPEFASAWDAVPFADRDPPHQLARLLERGSRHEDLVKALEGAFVHKLNHRLDLPSESIEFLAAAGTSQLYPPARRSTPLRA